MENAQTASLTRLMDEERERLLARLAEDRSPAAAREALAGALDRIGYRYVELCGDARLSAAAQGMLCAVKNALALMEAVNDCRTWRRELPGREKKALAPLTLGMLVAGAVLAVAGALAQYFASGRLGAVGGLLRALLPALLGGGLLFWAGLRAGKPGRKDEKKRDEPEARLEFLVNPEDAWHAVRAAVVLADADLDALREQMAVERLDRESAQARGPLSAAESELLANLLETAYAHRTDAMAADAAEMIAEIRYFLHGMGVELADYAPDRAAWFELLPAPAPGTLRPALVREGKVLRKGLAASAGAE